MGLNRWTVLLAVAVAALAVWIFGIDIPRERRAFEERQEAALLVPMDPAAVDTLRVERADGGWTVVRRDDGWWLTDPIVERAEDRVVESVLERITTETRQRELNPELDEASWSSYGLAEGQPARADLILASDEGESQRLAVGIEVVTGEFCYVRREGSDALELADINVLELVRSAHHGFRLRSLFEVDDEAIVRLEGRGPAGRWVAVRDTTTGLWWSGPPGTPPRLRRWEMDDIALVVSTQTIAAYLRDGLSEREWSGYGLDRPWAELSVTDRSGRTTTVWFGNEANDQQYFARRQGLDTVLAVSPSFVGVLDHGLQGWEDRNPIPRNVKRAISFRVDDGSGRWAEIRRGEREWTLLTEDGEVATSTYRENAARNVARGLEEMQPGSTVFVAGDRHPAVMLSEKTASVDIRWPDGGTITLQFGWRPDEDGAWFYMEDGRALVEVDRGMLLRLRALVDALHAPAES